MKRYRPKLDRLYWILLITTNALTLCAVVIPSLFSPVALLVTLPVFAFVNYFFVSPLFGYVELREREVLIKYGFILKREIPYEKIRRVEKKRKFYSDSMLSLKSSLEHVDIRYNSFDVTAVSVKDNDEFVAELNARCEI